MRDGPSGTGFPRRGILRALALAPAALAGCAGPAAERASAAGDPAAPKPSPAGAPPPGGGAVAVVRAFRLAADAEPAFSFRAAMARPGEPR
jgi:hypothetical protein